MNRACASPITLATLAEYWLGELDAEREAELDEHLLGCGECSAALAGLAELAGGVRALVRAGAVRTVVTDAFLERLAAAGRKVREYRVPPGGSVNCTVAPDDDLLVSRLEAPLAGLEQVDVVLLDIPGKPYERLRDVPFDAKAGAVVVTERVDTLRAAPAGRVRVQLYAVRGEAERLLGEYTFNHAPWPGRG
ncbi:MAG: zf-HC2 domain-containing protein [Burkholderiales bacterium]|nr:zf-HC2 domain-containing protein [Burkholderiales bacterium]